MGREADILWKKSATPKNVLLWPGQLLMILCRGGFVIFYAATWRNKTQDYCITFCILVKRFGCVCD